MRAFPGKSFDDDGDLIYNLGMTLRDWFAGMALTAGKTLNGLEIGSGAADIARDMYKIADAMIAEREK